MTINAPELNWNEVSAIEARMNNRRMIANHRAKLAAKDRGLIAKLFALIGV